MDLVTPISHLFKDKKNAELIMENTDFLEARERTCELFFPKTTHYHIDFDLNIGLTEKQIQFLVDFVKPREEINTLTFQAARDCEKINIIDGIYYPNSEVISINDQIQNTKKSLSQIRNVLGTERKIGIENNNFYPTGAYEICTSSEYLLSIIDSYDCYLLFDIAHALVTCANKNISFKNYYKSLLETKKCIQMHLCQPSYSHNELGIEAKDAHEIPNFELIELSVSLCTNYEIKKITVEYYKEVEKLVLFLRYLRNFISKNEKR